MTLKAISNEVRLGSETSSADSSIMQGTAYLLGLYIWSGSLTVPAKVASLAKPIFEDEDTKDRIRIHYQFKRMGTRTFPLQATLPGADEPDLTHSERREISIK